MCEQVKLHCAYCHSSLEGRPRYASGGHTTYDETCSKLLQTALASPRGGETKEAEIPAQLSLGLRPALTGNLA